MITHIGIAGNGIVGDITKESYQSQNNQKMSVSLCKHLVWDSIEGKIEEMTFWYMDHRIMHKVLDDEFVFCYDCHATMDKDKLCDHLKEVEGFTPCGNRQPPKIELKKSDEFLKDAQNLKKSMPTNTPLLRGDEDKNDEDAEADEIQEEETLKEVQMWLYPEKMRRKRITSLMAQSLNKTVSIDMGNDLVNNLNRMRKGSEKIKYL